MIAGYTDPQFKALSAAFHKGSAMQARVQRAGGSYTRLCDRLVVDGLLSPAPYTITLKGLAALKIIYQTRWVRHGCMAYLLDLDAVDAALKASA